MMDFGFADIPGLLTPEMSGNLRNQMMMGAAIGLMKGGGPSSVPNPFNAFAEGMQGALTQRNEGQTSAFRQLLLSEQAKKLADERAQRDAWQRIFGVASPIAAGPAAAPAVAPPGLMAPPASTDTPAAAPEADARPPGLMAPGTGRPTPTRDSINTDASIGLRQVLAGMPPAMRELIGMLGPQKGMEAIQTYIGKKFDKPSDTFLSVRDANGNVTSHRADSPALDRAIAAGGTIVTTPSSAPDREIVSLRGVDGVVRSYRKDDPAIDRVLQAGGTMVTTPSSDPNSGKPSDTFHSVKMPDGSIRAFRADSAALDRALNDGGVMVTTPSSNPNDHTKKPDAYLLPNGETVLSDDGKTYTDASGRKQSIPQVGTIKLGADTAYESARAAKVEKRAKDELDASGNSPAAAARPPAEGPTDKGTGPWSALKGAADAVVGGLGIDKAFGRKGVFPETTANRQYLRNLRQVGKTAMVNNPRFPVAEQKNVDELFPDPDSFWTNPHSEAQKIPIMRNMLLENLRANNEAIAGGGLTKEERSKLTSNNIEIRRALRLVGEGDASLDALDPAGAAVTANATRAAGGGSAWDRVGVGQIVIQGGRRYQKQADGSARELQ
jgi:hypothetical protein